MAVAAGASGIARAAEAPAPPAAAPPAAAPAAVPPAKAEAAAAPAVNPYAGLPKVVAQAVKELEAACRAEGGAPKWNPKTVFDVVNVSPDGRPDYLIDTHAMECGGGITPWIGSDGFRHILFISIGPGRWTRAFDRGARGFDIIAPKGGARPQVIVFSHSAYCTRPNPERFMRRTQIFEWRRGKLRKVSEEWFEG
ncbi:hypothetical protein [Xanthobacter sp.]|uniref:hypothetical protein n=1 Tax=Xanthobacter sp. TaxID=35809 RepID=UPI0025DC046D|nr:hypothetical protein [Xanthobacter sp.]